MVSLLLTRNGKRTAAAVCGVYEGRILFHTLRSPEGIIIIGIFNVSAAAVKKAELFGKPCFCGAQFYFMFAWP
jgi:hypothetical protein